VNSFSPNWWTALPGRPGTRHGPQLLRVIAGSAGDAALAGRQGSDLMVLHMF